MCAVFATTLPPQRCYSGFNKANNPLTMHLTTTVHGTHTAPTIIKDLTQALTKSYRYLQAVLMEVRAIGVIESRLNLKWAELKLLAHQVMIHLYDDALLAIAQENKQTDTNLNSRITTHLPKAAQRYVVWKKNNPKTVVMVLQPNYHLGVAYYLTYGSDALKLDRHTDRLRIYTVVDGVGVPCVGIPASQIAKYQAELATQDISLLLVN